MNSELNPSQIIEDYFSELNGLNPFKSYPTELPEELLQWYVYLSDSGHCILAFLEPDFDESDIEPMEMLPCSVKTVLRKYQIIKGYPVIPIGNGLKYDDVLGLVTPSEDYEF